MLQATDGVTARIFGMFNDLGVLAIRSGTECIDDASVEAWRPIGRAMPAYVCDGRLLSPGLPYVPESFSGELLSSWLRRAAIEYGVDLPHLAGHIGRSVSRAPVIDRGLSTNDVRRAASVLRSTPAGLRGMMHASSVRALAPTTLLLQLCLTCQANHQATTRTPVSIRAWFKLWSIECYHCSTPFSPPGPPHLDRVNPAREEPV